MIYDTDLGDISARLFWATLRYFRVARCTYKEFRWSVRSSAFVGINIYNWSWFYATRLLVKTRKTGTFKFRSFMIQVNAYKSYCAHC